MAKQYKNKKNFLVIQLNFEEVLKIWGQYGGVGICDRCNKIEKKGYYVACLNEYFCESCFKQWLKSAVNYEEDRPFEKRYYKDTVSILARAGLWEQ